MKTCLTSLSILSSSESDSEIGASHSSSSSDYWDSAHPRACRAAEGLQWYFLGLLRLFHDFFGLPGIDQSPLVPQPHYPRHSNNHNGTPRLWAQLHGVDHIRLCYRSYFERLISLQKGHYIEGQSARIVCKLGSDFLHKAGDALARSIFWRPPHGLVQNFGGMHLCINTWFHLRKPGTVI